MPATLAVPPARSAHRSADAAVWEGIVAATGIPHGRTTYAPGAIGRSLGRRTPKGTYGRSWMRPVAQVLAAEELEPGDPRLPATLDGRPWPARAGAVWARLRFIVGTADGRAALAAARTAGPTDWMLGFVVAREHREGAGRVVDDLDVMQLWPRALVDDGDPRRGPEVKALGAALEFKAGGPGAGVGALTRVDCAGGCGRSARLSFPVLGKRGYVCSACLEEATDGLADALARYRADRPDADEPDAPESAAVQTECSVCGLPGGIVAAEVPRGAVVVCADCTADVRDDLVDALARFGERELGAEEAYITAAEREQAYTLLGDGTLEPATDDPTRGAAWTRTTRGGWGTP